VGLWKDFSLLSLMVNNGLFKKQFIHYDTVSPFFLPPWNPLKNLHTIVPDTNDTPVFHCRQMQDG